MEIFGIDIVQAITNPVGAIVTALSGAALYQGWKFLKSLINPMQYAEKLYEVADNIIIQADDNFIDKIRNKMIKDDVQKDLSKALENRKAKIDELIKRISD